MERNFYTDEFEELIRKKTGQYKMYPSDRVWKEIYISLHAKRRRFVVGMTVLIGGFLILAGRELLLPSKHPDAGRKITISDLPKNAESSDLPLSFSFAGSKKTVGFQQLNHPPADNRQDDTEPGYQPDVEGFATLTAPQFNQDALTPAGASTEVAATTDTHTSDPLTATGQPPSNNLRSDNSSIENLASATIINIAGQSRQPQALSRADLDKIQKAETDAERENRHQINWLQDYAVQHLAPVRQHRMNLQIYFSPTVNYRKLAGPDYAPIKPAIPNVPLALIHFGNINNYVDHSPAPGYEFGGSMVYRITRNISFKAGLQFSYSQYYIGAYASNRQPAALTLSSYYGYITDSLTSTIGNFGGKYRVDLQNKYYELSAPIGLELRVIGNGRLQLNIAGTLQPTYLLNTNSYLLTNDYTKYIKEPSLFRRWNLNGGLEAFLSYQAGGLRWQIGPQFRYQLYSTYKDQYPVKEYLMEYGIKIAVSRLLK